MLEPAFEITDITDAFNHATGRDLTGYEDGTENPQDDEALQVALLHGSAAPLAGSSFLALQHWHHQLDLFEAMPRQPRDHTIGRDADSNEELDDAPESAHVKRTAQESFSPEAFVLRRSMPWVKGNRGGWCSPPSATVSTPTKHCWVACAGSKIASSMPCSPSANPKPAPISGARPCAKVSSICARWVSLRVELRFPDDAIDTHTPKGIYGYSD